MTPALLSPLRLRELELPNRIVVSPMCQYSAVDGCATNWHLVHLGQYAVSGAGLVILEATHVERRGRITHGCLGLYSAETESALERVLRVARSMAAPGTLPLKRSAMPSLGWSRRVRELGSSWVWAENRMLGAGRNWTRTSEALSGRFLPVRR